MLPSGGERRITMRKSLALVLLGVLIFNPEVLRFAVRLLLELKTRAPGA
jgi:hypothetical protein